VVDGVDAAAVVAAAAMRLQAQGVLTQQQLAGTGAVQLSALTAAAAAAAAAGCVKGEVAGWQVLHVLKGPGTQVAVQEASWAAAAAAAAAASWFLHQRASPHWRAAASAAAGALWTSTCCQHLLQL
jgi:hypothetical protein